jgi:hypothetical protein
MKIEWTDTSTTSPWRMPTWQGYIGTLHVATIHESRHDAGKWWVSVHLAPLPDELDGWTDTVKASEKQAKATAQRVVNAFTKILNGEKT